MAGEGDVVQKAVVVTRGERVYVFVSERLEKAPTTMMDELLECGTDLTRYADLTIDGWRVVANRSGPSAPKEE